MILTFTQDKDKIVGALFARMMNDAHFEEQHEIAMEAHWEYINSLREQVRRETV